jgi:hypothetical protein
MYIDLGGWVLWCLVLGLVGAAFLPRNETPRPQQPVNRLRAPGLQQKLYLLE